MPADYPDFPSHHQIFEYFKGYADAFGLRDQIRFNSRIETAERKDGGGWRLTVADQDGTHEETADYLIVASGHHRVPYTPDLEGDFTGEQLHSAQYRSTHGFRNKRVLVVGGGNSACDIAAALARVSSHVSMSLRSPQYIVPKTVLGRPIDVQYNKLQKFPRFLRNAILRYGVKLYLGPYDRYHLPQPDEDVLATHPTLNTDILEQLTHGTVAIRRTTLSASGCTVFFEGGDSDEFDAIIWATGYQTMFPFFRDGLFDWSDKTRLPLYMKMMPAEMNDVFFIGLIQPLGCIWALADLQAEMAAQAIMGRWKRPLDMNRRIEIEHEADAKRFRQTVRHAVEVDFHDYRNQISRELAKTMHGSPAG
jgi:pyruvate/2-oxoglutarate dehydrogenase complex dihydrolipoamide dehydrogenase (E3) component